LGTPQTPAEGWPPSALLPIFISLQLDLISNPVEEGYFGDTPSPGRGLAALCTPADFHLSLAGVDMIIWGHPTPGAAAPGPRLEKFAHRVN